MRLGGKKMEYSEEDIKIFEETKECDPCTLSIIAELLKDGWIIYDTQPEINNENIKYLLFVKNQDK